MNESSAYEIIMDEGEVRGLRRTLLRQGRKLFGEPDQTVSNTLQTITDLDRLGRTTERLLEVKTWQELLETP